MLRCFSSAKSDANIEACNTFPTTVRLEGSNGGYKTKQRTSFWWQLMLKPYEANISSRIISASFHAKKQSRCMKPPVGGSCRNFVVAWYYDYKKQYCKIFLYGGCGGNDNKFSSEISCQQVCLPEKIPKRYCGAQPILSPCAGGTQHWYFHPHRRICLPYPTGRCGKKENNTFKSCVECMNRCTDRNSEKVCKMIKQRIWSKQRNQKNQTRMGKF